MVETLEIPVSARRALRVLVQERSPKHVEALGMVTDAKTGEVLLFMPCSSYTRHSAIHTLGACLRRAGQGKSARALAAVERYPIL